MIGRIVGVGITGVIGILLIVLGWLLWKKEMITLMHDYHVDKVSPKTRAAFCKQSGIGLIVMGMGLTITSVILGITDFAFSFICFVACFVVGLFMLITAGMKYNR